VHQDHHAVHSNPMTQRRRLSDTVDIACALCGKPMVMLSFNYKSLERGFESISLRCQYCNTEDTRPWPLPDASGESPDQQTRPSEADGRLDLGHANEIDAPTVELDSKSPPEEQPSTLDPNSTSPDAELTTDHKPTP